MPASQALASIPEAFGFAFANRFVFVDAVLFFRFSLQDSRIHQNLFEDAFARWQNRQGGPGGSAENGRDELRFRSCGRVVTHREVSADAGVTGQIATPEPDNNSLIDSTEIGPPKKNWLLR